MSSRVAPVLATFASLASALSGAALAVRRVLRLTPAEGCAGRRLRASYFALRTGRL